MGKVKPGGYPGEIGITCPVCGSTSYYYITAVGHRKRPLCRRCVMTDDNLLDYEWAVDAHLRSMGINPASHYHRKRLYPNAYVVAHSPVGLGWVIRRGFMPEAADPHFDLWHLGDEQKALDLIKRWPVFGWEEFYPKVG